MTSLKKITFALLLWTGAGHGAPAGSPDDADLACAELYVMAAQLEAGTRRWRSPLFNEKTNVIATAIGSVTTAGYYYFGIAAGRGYYRDYRLHRRLPRLDEVRRQLAQNHCFRKF